jgi:hypothetical protein
MTTTINITPSPRVLRMLGQIDFAPWQCLAELIDNSIDAYIDQQKEGVAALEPRISIQLPNDALLRSGAGEITVTDNARGMTVAQLTNAVRAGYSGNDPVEKMGLFGMGFNISTARMGRRTEVWTATADAEYWTGVIIDFDSLERTQSFETPVQTRRKSDAELATLTHGTHVKITRLEADRVRPLMWGVGKRRTKEKLGKIYGRVMSDMDIAIIYDGDRIMPVKHCIWDAKRSVETQAFGRVPAMIPIDEALPPRRYCTSCWVWLTEHDTSCAACGNTDNVIERQRRLRGWVGIQRYFDKEHYGIDLIRNGRVIEELDKSLFTYTNDMGEKLLEYPIDATHWGGRIVGELEVDFVRVSHQKDSFDKLDPEWKRVVELVRGASPMQPRIAERMSLPRNDSPLARLFAGYRKGTAGLKDLVPGTSKGDGLNTGLVQEYLQRFRDGDPEYQSDDNWYDLVLQADRVKRGHSAGAKEAAGDLPIAESGGDEPTTSEDSSAQEQEPNTSSASSAETKIDAELTREYGVAYLPGSPAIRVEAHRHSAPINGKPFAVQPDGYKFRFDYDGNASYFEDSLETPTDCLLIDLAHHFLALSGETVRRYPMSEIVRYLRETYFPDRVTRSAAAAEAATALLTELRRHCDEALSEAYPISIAEIDAKELEHIRKAALQAESVNSPEIEARIREGRFARFVTLPYTVEIVRRWPQVVADNKFFTRPFATLTEDLQEVSKMELVNALQDVRWLTEEGSASVSKDLAWRLRYTRALASLRLVQSWRV